MKFLPLKKKKEFLRVLKQGRHFKSSSLTLVMLEAQEARFAVCVGKKFGKSVARNRIKRLLREAFRAHCEAIDRPMSILLIPKVAESYSYDTFQRDLNGILRRTQTWVSSQRKPALSEAKA